MLPSYGWQQIAVQSNLQNHTNEGFLYTHWVHKYTRSYMLPTNWNSYLNYNVKSIEIEYNIGSCFYYVAGHDQQLHHFSWTSASTICRSLGGTLPTIRSIKELDFILEVMEHEVPFMDFMFIGLHNSPQNLECKQPDILVKKNTFFS